MVKVIVVEPERCTGCRTCELACSLKKTGECNPQKSRIRVLSMPHEGLDLPVICQHCENAPCRTVCSVGALQRKPQTGAMILEPSVCIGCNACMMVCPYGAINVDLERRELTKCDLCDGDPTCVKYCVTEAIRFVEADMAAKTKRQRMLNKFAGPLLRSRELLKNEVKK